jgi:hypothetical protein
MIATLLGWTELPQWALELIVIAAVAGGVWYWQHERFESGIAQQQQVDAASKAQLVQSTDEATARLQAIATAAELAYVHEHQDNLDYQRDHPMGAVSLCISAANSGSRVPPVSPLKPGAKGASAPATDVSAVPAGNPSGGPGVAAPDIGHLLGSFATACDEVSATLREYQQR